MAASEKGPQDGQSFAGGQGGLSHLPWQQVPKFIPGQTNIDEYTQRLKFLRELWPAEHISHLGPRAALMIEGSAFHRISRISPEKLKSADGVQLIVEALGGSWGKSPTEEEYYLFEQAIFQVTQRPDEANDSYVARHEAFFDQLLAKNVTIEEIRAYVLLRHSMLSPEDKKRVVVEAGGELKYQETVRSVILLGSRFFQDLQNKGSAGNGKLGERNKVYDVQMAADEEEDQEVHLAGTSEEEPSDEDILIYFLEFQDEDAIYISEFEDHIVEAVQESTLAPVYASYQEARSTWLLSSSSKG